MKLKDKTALVTGASRGIGEAIALAFGRAGADVVVHYYVEPAKAEHVATSIRSMGRKAWTTQADLADPAAIDEMFRFCAREVKTLDILVNNAGFEIVKPLEEFTLEEWDGVQQVNLRGSFLCMQHAIGMMRSRGGGRIINISSIHDRVPRPGNIAYCVSKAGLLMLTKGAALELAEHHILVNAISPGAVLTDMNREGLDRVGIRWAEQHIPLKRIGDPEDIAAAAVYLASDDASYVTGTTIYIDGGLGLRRV
ncbi:MAG: glucose 1-dehydrogenase [Ignavibacteria bacterium]|nr:glucose 1-dehydrogenase [Ignavibacteria bacterium]